MTKYKPIRFPLWIRNFGPTWKQVAEISDVDTFRRVASNALLVALDLEGILPNITEIGLAIIDASADVDFVSYDGYDLDKFRFDNSLDAHSVEISDHARHIRPVKYGHHTVVSEAEVAQTMQDILARLRQAGRPLILVRFDLHTELVWMSGFGPSLLSFFDAWVDLLDILRVGTRPPSLRKVMNDMAGPAQYTTKVGTHKASNDCAAILAVASRILAHQSVPFSEQPLREFRILKKSDGKFRNRAFRAKITAIDGELLPKLNSSDELALRFNHHDLVDVLLKEYKPGSGRDPEWWLCFKNRADLSAFATELEDCLVSGQKLQVEQVIAPWVEFAERDKQRPYDYNKTVNIRG